MKYPRMPFKFDYRNKCICIWTLYWDNSFIIGNSRSFTLLYELFSFQKNSNLLLLTYWNCWLKSKNNADMVQRDRLTKAMHLHNKKSCKALFNFNYHQLHLEKQTLVFCTRFLWTWNEFQESMANQHSYGVYNVRVQYTRVTLHINSRV